MGKDSFGIYLCIADDDVWGPRWTTTYMHASILKINQYSNTFDWLYIVGLSIIIENILVWEGVSSSIV